MLRLFLPNGYDFNVHDYGRPIAFIIYNENETPFDGSGYAGYIEISDEMGNRAVQEIQSGSISADGTGSFSFSSAVLLTTSTSEGFTQYYLSVRLEKPGVVISTDRCKIIAKTMTGTIRQP